MARKQVVTETQIIEAALDIVRQQGHAALTARAVAHALGVSTMPIYSTFHAFEALVSRLRSRALDLLTDYQARPYTPDVYLNLAMGYVIFAQEEPRLFRFYFSDAVAALSPEAQQQMRQAVFAKLGLDGPPVSALSDLPPVAQEAVGFKTWVFVHGLAVMTGSGLLQHRSHDELQRLLADVGGAFVSWEIR